MIKIYLTGATTPDGVQTNPAISFGDYVSQNELRNGDVDTLFCGVSEMMKVNPKSEYALIAVKNVGSVKTSFVIKPIVPADSYSNMEIAVVEPSDDGDGNLIFEHIQDKYSQPYYADFAPSTGVTIPTFKKNAVYGVWLRRTISPNALIPVPSDQLSMDFDNGTTLSKIDDVVIDFTYNE